MRERYCRRRTSWSTTSLRLLDVTDLVFIDPVSTGYSRAVPGEAPKQFHGIEEDVQSVGDFIRFMRRATSAGPRRNFLRAKATARRAPPGLSGYLQQRYGMYLNGIVLISTILNFETAEFDRGNDLPYILYLPTYTAIAWYHKKLPADLQGDLQKAVEESRKFAVGRICRCADGGRRSARGAQRRRSRKSSRG